MLSLFMAIANGVSWHELVAPLRLEFGVRERVFSMAGKVRRYWLFCWSRNVDAIYTYLANG